MTAHDDLSHFNIRFKHQYSPYHAQTNRFWHGRTLLCGCQSSEAVASGPRRFSDQFLKQFTSDLPLPFIHFDSKFTVPPGCPSSSVDEARCYSVWTISFSEGVRAKRDGLSFLILFLRGFCQSRKVGSKPVLYVVDPNERLYSPQAC